MDGREEENFWRPVGMSFLFIFLWISHIYLVPFVLYFLIMVHMIFVFNWSLYSKKCLIWSLRSAFFQFSINSFIYIYIYI